MGMGPISKRHHRLTLAADPDAAARCDYTLTIHPPQTVRKPTFVALTSYQQCIGGFNRWWGRDVARNAHSHLSPIFKNISFSFFGRNCQNNRLAHLLWHFSHPVLEILNEPLQCDQKPLTTTWNEMVSTGDTEISLHIRGPWNSNQLNPRWCWSRPTQPKVARSAQICMCVCVCVGGGGWWSRATQPKVPRSVWIYIFGKGGGGGAPDQLNPSAKICSNLHLGVGGGMIQTNSTQSGKICPNLHFRRGGGGWWSRPTQPKVPRSVQICIFGGGGEGRWGRFGPTFLKYLSAPTQVFLNQIFKHSS